MKSITFNELVDRMVAIDSYFEENKSSFLKRKNDGHTRFNIDNLVKCGLCKTQKAARRFANYYTEENKMKSYLYIFLDKYDDFEELVSSRGISVKIYSKNETKYKLEELIVNSRGIKF